MVASQASKQTSLPGLPVLIEAPGTHAVHVDANDNRHRLGAGLIDTNSKQVTGLPGAGWLARITFSWAYPVIRKVHASENLSLEQGDAYELMPEGDDSYQLSAKFDKVYERRVQNAVRSRADVRHQTARTLLELYWPRLVLHMWWCALETGLRLGSPVVLREFLSFLKSLKSANPEPQWRGWALSVGLGLLGFALTVTHHQLFWIGMRMGQQMRQMCIAAVHAKALRLNAATVASVSGGKVVNIVSNDVRRFDDAAPFWLYLIFGPLEIAMVLLMIALDLGIWPALAGVSTTLAIIPLQAALVTYVGGLRRNTAARTDERVRLAGEVIQGALAMKMLSWEEQLATSLCGIRASEASFIVKTARIKALNMAMQFAVPPLTSFITFAVARAVYGGFSVPSVFYTLSLLALPRLSMVTFFVLGVQTLTELRISLQRIDSFLCTPEPPLPMQQQPSGAAAVGAGSPPSTHNVNGYVALRGSDYDWLRPLGGAKAGRVHAAKPTQAPATAAAATSSAGAAEPQHVALRLGPDAQRSGVVGQDGDGTEAAWLHGEAAASGGGMLRGVELEVAPGELLGICGEVGSGKTSLLMALLGELQPLQPEAGPILHGTMAYCSQIPWIVAGTVRDNVTFGLSYDSAWYSAVLSACALDDDIAGLPAGDLTELGERGINLSGGQKARIALARACYSRAAVVLMDDPLSAVDPRVGRTLFECCIGPTGLMQGSTRLLVTHQRQYLPRCDRVLVLRGGCMAALGPWPQVSALQLRELVAGAAAVDAGGEQLGDVSVDDVAADVAADSPTLLLPLPLRPASATLSPLEVAPEPIAGHVQRLEHKPADISSKAATPALPEVWEHMPSPSQQPNGAQVAAAVDAGHISNSREGGGASTKLQLAEDCLDGVAYLAQAAASLQPSSRLPSGRLQRTRSLLSGFRLSRQSFGMAPTPRPETFDGKAGAEAVAAGGGGADGTAPMATATATAPVGQAGRLVLAEERSLGDVPLHVYFEYMMFMGPLISVVVVITLFGGQAVYLYSEFWLTFWARSGNQLQAKWLTIYAVLTAIVVVVSLTRAGLFFQGALRASTRIHNAMTRSVLYAPLAFFHTNPAGRILNRFSKDLGQVDDLLPTTTFDALQSGFQCLGAFILVAVAVPVVLPLFLPLAIAFYFYRRQYIIGSREIKRWEAVARSPVFAFFSATLKGLPTIRAYSASQRFHHDFLSTLSLSGAWYFATIATARWIGFRLDIVAACTLTGGCVLSMVMQNSIDAALLGLALSHVLQLTGLMQWFVRQTVEVENGMTCVERMLEYTKLPQEPPRVGAGGAAPPPGWPRTGALRYEHVTATYRPGLPPVLRDISFELHGGQSCGVVGRTGSGKSSLMLTLFRLIDINTGTIYLDELDTASIGLDALRRQLAIIPQDPVLFSGTLRSNLDPWDAQPDAKLWSVLEAVQLRPAIEAAGGLHTRMAEAGDNLSVGQRQLFCLARALLQDARVLALDEATANVDRATDALIQRALRDFAHEGDEAGCRVLLVIAHRIDTVLDCDRLLVLSSGNLVESGSPAELAGKPGGMFSRMVGAARVAAHAAPRTV